MRGLVAAEHGGSQGAAEVFDELLLLQMAYAPQTYQPQVSLSSDYSTALPWDAMGCSPRQGAREHEASGFSLSPGLTVGQHQPQRAPDASREEWLRWQQAQQEIDWQSCHVCSSPIRAAWDHCPKCLSTRSGGTLQTLSGLPGELASNNMRTLVRARTHTYARQHTARVRYEQSPVGPNETGRKVHPPKVQRCEASRGREQERAACHHMHTLYEHSTLTSSSLPHTRSRGCNAAQQRQWNAAKQRRLQNVDDTSARCKG